MIACPRCQRANFETDARCTSCSLPFDAALRAKLRAESAAAKAVDVIITRGTEPPVDESQTRSDEREQRQVRDAQHATLAQVLEIEVEHVRALADAGIHTLEHVAESLPEQIAHALRDWTHIDPAALIARARRVLHREPLPEIPWTRGHEQLLADPDDGPDPAEWWKVT